ncbi:MAG: hypothetical protein R3F49_20090 [Planctomycetota bacterium]
MTNVRRIGLSLGADICWPRCYEGILRRWNPTVKVGGESVRFEVERVTIEPFDLRQPVRYDLVIDRLTHWYASTREWIKKAVVMDDLYVFNNPWSVQSMEKQTTYCAMMRLGMPIPDTWLVPPKEYEPKPDLQRTLTNYAKLFDLEQIGNVVGFPLFMKPYDGGGWVGVSGVKDAEELRKAYETSGKFVMHLQHAVEGWSHFVRGIGVGPQVRVIQYDPDQPLHSRYTPHANHLPQRDLDIMRRMVLTINAFFGWDFNSCEALGAPGGTWSPIDFANPCPDSQVTSLHRHFPWLVLAKLKWSLFCAATKRKFRRTLDWEPFFAIAATDAPFETKLEQYEALANERFATREFEEFCATELAGLDEVAHEFFGTAEAREAVRDKVAALYPEHEVDEFTDRFWMAIQTWRNEESAVAKA